MKKSIFKTTAIIGMGVFLSSCYSYSHTVGRGPQKGEEIEAKNHYLFYGLAKLKVSNADSLVGDAKDYEIKIEHNITDQLLNGFTLGIYTPTTTTVRK